MGKTIIIEGRYDKATGKVVKDIMTIIKKTAEYPVDEMVQIQLPYGLDGTDEYELAGISFSVEVNIMRAETFKTYYDESDIVVDDYKIESFRVSDEDVLEFNMVINPKVESKAYQKMYYKLQEDVRHEMEHLTQHGTNRMEDRPEKTDTSEDETTYEHHLKKDEIPALVHGFYRRAKLEGKGLDEVMIDDLDYEIELKNLTKSEAQEIFKVWILYAKRRLPKAVYSKN
jgi:hypothetical protein